MAVVLDQLAREKFNSYKADIARLNNTASVAENFTVTPSVEQKIIVAYQESDDFLKKVNVYPVTNQQGQKIGMMVGTSVASTTDTRTQARSPVNVGALNNRDEYQCSQTNYDVAYPWSLLNAWRHHPDFKTKLSTMVVKAIALDKLKIGFNGTHRAPTSDRNTYPLLNDVKKGWLQKIRDNAPQQVYSGTSGKITVGAGGEFETLDGLAVSAIETFIAEQFRDNTDLVAVCGRGILADKYLPLLDKAQDPTEQIAARTLFANKVIGTLPVVIPPFFPKNTILITSLDNLSIYLQSGTLVRMITQQPEWDRDVDWQSVNEDFVVEDYDKCVLLENIEMVK